MSTYSTGAWDASEKQIVERLLQAGMQESSSFVLTAEAMAASVLTRSLQQCKDALRAVWFRTLLSDLRPPEQPELPPSRRAPARLLPPPPPRKRDAVRALAPLPLSGGLSRHNAERLLEALYAVPVVDRGGSWLETFAIGAPGCCGAAGCGACAG